MFEVRRDKTFDVLGSKFEVSDPRNLEPSGEHRTSNLTSCQRGVTYIMLMFSIVLIGIALSAVGKQWKVVVQRDREAELVFRGNRIKTAIQLYAADYEVQKASRPNRYPLNLEQLTHKQPKRYLPVVYKDPITGKDFDLIKVGAEIRGVKSRSKQAPLDQVQFKRATAYNQIAFQVETQAAPGCIPSPNPLNPLLSVPCPAGPPGGAVTPPTPAAPTGTPPSP
jgi:type II secretory pathway pseudopilin PulG